MASSLYTRLDSKFELFKKTVFLVMFDTRTFLADIYYFIQLWCLRCYLGDFCCRIRHRKHLPQDSDPQAEGCPEG